VIATEPALLGRCRDVGLPVPQVLAESRTGPAAHLPYIVYRWIEGDVLADRLRTLPVDRQDAVAAHLGELLSRFRGVVCEGFGELVDGTRAQERSWEDFLASSVALGLEAIARYDLLAPSLQERLRAALHQMRGLSPIGESTLVWGDVSFENVLIGQDDRVAGLIDFESCLSGDPLATLGFCYAAQGNHPFCSRLLSASPEAAGASARQRVALYAVLRLLRLAPHAHQALPTGYPRDDLIDIFPGFLPALSELTA
jgi:aminoglycoside phosphotransferase (APT) family kinase protein